TRFSRDWSSDVCSSDLSCSTVDPVEVTVLHDDPLPTAGPVDDEPGALLDHTVVAYVGNGDYRVEVGRARRGDGETVIAALRVTGVPLTTHLDARGREPCLGDWHLLGGDYGDRADLHSSPGARPLRFSAVEVPDDQTVVLRGREVEVTWSLAGPHPVATVAVTPETSGRHVVVFHGMAAAPDDDIAEVLCGALQHGRGVGGPESLGAFELPTPACLVESGGWTRGLFVPAAAHELADEMVKDPDDQPYGMSLRDRDGAVRPTVALPQYGRRACLEAGRTATFTVGLYARP